MNNKKWLIIPVILLLAVGSAGAWVYKSSENTSEVEGDIAANDVMTEQNVETAAGDEPAAAATTDDTSSVKPSDIHVTVDGATPSTPRSIGLASAPVTIVEYSSLTCPHCAHAHEAVLPSIIKDYVEAGKVRIVFSDFPLNKEALDASKVSRCVANDQYFAFLTMLFSDIEKWAYAGKHPEALLTNAQMTGLSPERAKECLNDKALEESLIKGAQDAAAKYGINSTPTFVLNDGKKTIMGARPYSEFKAAIDALLAEKK